MVYRLSHVKEGAGPHKHKVPEIPPITSWLCGRQLIMQNKANFKMGNINISTARTKAYAKEQRTMNNEHDSKQTQSKPISNAQTAYSAYQTRDCHVASLLAMTGRTKGAGRWEKLECRISNIEF
jgi:hypothetical protein